MDIFKIIKVPFGYLLRTSYGLLGSYALALVVFAIVIRLVLFPLGLKQQKGYVKQARLRPKENLIRKKYAGRTDKVTQEKLNAEILDLYKRENYSPFAGCLPLLIQLPILISLFYVVTQPITYITPNLYQSEVNFRINVTDKATAADEYMNEALLFIEPEKFGDNALLKIVKEGDTSEIYDSEGNKLVVGVDFKIVKELTLGKIRESAIDAVINNSFEGDGKTSSAYKQISFIQQMQMADPEVKKISQSVIKAVPLTADLKEINFKLFGIDLLATPNSNLLSILILIPILSGAFSFLQMRISKKLTGAAVQQQAGPSGKIMDFIMPVFSIYIAFIVPAAIGFYWLISNIIQILQQLLLSKMFPIPTLGDLEASASGTKGSSVALEMEKAIELPAEEPKSKTEDRFSEYSDDFTPDENDDDDIQSAHYSDEEENSDEAAKTQSGKRSNYMKTGKSYSGKKKK